MKAEPRIFEKRPAWYGLQEISRNETTVKFKTKTGSITALVREVEEYRLGAGK